MPAKTEVGSVFISNYPPYSQWSKEGLDAVREAFNTPPGNVPLGLYVHIPFCRKRCKFCYFRVYTDKNAADVQHYVDALAQEMKLVSRLPVMGDRSFRFVYFGGGTPSFLSVKQLAALVDRLKANARWDDAEEVTFECEPGTLSEPKVRALRDLGVTRLSLGVENFSDAVLEENARAHLSREIDRSWEWITAARFDSVNIDLIAGMVGETWENWRECVRRTLDMAPDSVTMYQMELPFNTVYSQDVLDQRIEMPIADWETKRDWVRYAFRELTAAGYHISSAYTLVKDLDRVRFRYRDHLWAGSDLLATGVASFGHVSGCHYQDLGQWNEYLSLLENGQLPLGRGMRATPHQLLVRAMILQLKRGWLDREAFRRKFQSDIVEQWREVWNDYADRGWLTVDDDRIELTEEGLLRADSLLPAFFEAEHQGVRYT
ncbi:MAG: coproporphyrinogen-III oxidase family protein [Pirellulales bacterium]